MTTNYGSSTDEAWSAEFSNDKYGEKDRKESFSTISRKSEIVEHTGPTETAAALEPRTWRDYTTFCILCLINLLNYMDRYTVAGVLNDIQKYYDIDDAEAGLLQTVFIATFVVFSPICGYLGDRYNRKWVMVVGICIWLSSVLASSFIPPDYFWAFMLMRGIVGIGEASYAVICPSLIADMFHGIMRSRMLMVFYFAIPVGSGLGYIVGATVAGLTEDWRWGVRVTAIGGVFCLAAIIFFVSDRPRGQMEVNDLSELDKMEKNYWKDLVSLAKNATYITSTLGYTAVVFVVGTLAWWVPSAIQYAEADSLGYNSTSLLTDQEKASSTIMFGFITTISGFAGVTIGTLGSNMLNKGTWCFKCCKTERSDPIMCAVGALIGIPTLFAVIQTIPVNQAVSYVCMFFAITGLCFNWATNVDMLMSVVVPGRRSTANAIQILTSHLFGDGSGPYIIGAISDAIRGTMDDPDSPKAHWTALSYSFYIPNVILIPSVILYAVSAATFIRDRRIFQKEMGQLPPTEPGKVNSAYSSEETSKI